MNIASTPGYVDVDLGKCFLNEIENYGLLACCCDVFIGCGLLGHEPFCLHVVLGVVLVSSCVEIADVQPFPKIQQDACYGASGSAARRLVDWDQGSAPSETAASMTGRLAFANSVVPPCAI